MSEVESILGVALAAADPRQRERTKHYSRTSIGERVCGCQPGPRFPAGGGKLADEEETPKGMTGVRRRR